MHLTPPKHLLSLSFVCFLVASCVRGPLSQEQIDVQWAKRLESEILRLGTQNWIVIADPAFPALSPDGITTLTTNLEAPQVLYLILQTIESQSSLKPKIAITRESLVLSEKIAPGIDEYRKMLKLVMPKAEPEFLSQNVLRLLIEGAKKKFRILVIKTNTQLPYSSIFIELDNGYWDEQAEEALRKRIKA